ncbi:MAG: GNAT family N-acetyltransferase [Anaerolineae bacterium]|nr:GNAT family N-acetyltransferase [Anaerolineae bacterium]
MDELALADRLAQQLIALNSSLRFGVVQTLHEREAIYRLRYQEVIRRGWAKPEDYPDGLEHDAYDENAIHMAGWVGDTLAATTRLVLPSPAYRLPTEETFNLTMEPQGRVVDVGRTIVAAAYRDGRRHTVFLGMLGQVWIELRARNFSEICGVFTQPIMDLYRAIGFEVIVLGQAQPYYGTERYPIRIDMAKSARALYERWSTVGLAPKSS